MVITKCAGWLRASAPAIVVLGLLSITTASEVRAQYEQRPSERWPLLPIDSAAFLLSYAASVLSKSDEQSGSRPSLLATGVLTTVTGIAAGLAIGRVTNMSLEGALLLGIGIESVAMPILVHEANGRHGKLWPRVAVSVAIAGGGILAAGGDLDAGKVTAAAVAVPLLQLAIVIPLTRSAR
jgi:hypothetical protein